MMCFRSSLTLLVAFLPALLFAGEVKTLSGQTVEGTLVRLAVDGVVVRPKEGQEKTLPLAEVLAIELAPASKEAPDPTAVRHRIRLTDGTRFDAAEVRFVAGRLEAKLPGAGAPLAVPLAAVASVLLDAQDQKNQDEFQAALAKGPQTDVVRLASRDGKSVNVFEGVIGDADAQGTTLRFTPEGGQPAQVAVGRLRSVAFARPAAVEAPLGKLTDSAGSQFALASLAVGEKELRVKTPAGLELALPLAEAVRIDLSAGKLVYLSDLEPLRVETEHLAFVPPAGQRYGRDKTLKGGVLAVGKKRYAKGLSLHSKTVLEFDASGYNAFRCVLGLDDAVGRVGSALVRIEADGKELFSQPVSRGDAKPHEVELKLAGVKRLRLIVDFGDDFDLGDHVDFADARMMK